MRLSKDSLSKMSISELEGKLIEVKANYQNAAKKLSTARQNQVLKMKAVKGKASKRKRELISQILELERQTAKVEVKTAKINFGINTKFSSEIAKAAQKVITRRNELKRTGTYQTSLSDYEKVLAWCHDMGVDGETFNQLLEEYTIEELANMSGDDFYDEVIAVVRSAEIQERLDWEAPTVESIMF